MRHTEAHNEARNQAGANNDRGLRLRAELKRKRNRWKTREQRKLWGGKKQRTF